MLTKEQITRKLRDNNQYFSDEFGLKKIGLEFVECLETLFGKKTDVITVAGLKAIRSRDIAKSIEETVEYV
ncbi:MAG: hypothetical protein D3919_10880 [Candidatus Electrothrix sp. AW5]|nr:hypothetical protein [Candidatus Electrothrix gigas]MCI5196708.1 hypothetical protein [Candidatus Electrothrix gigas]